FHHLLATGDDAYLMPIVVEFDSQERLDVFLAALQRVIDRHDILRTSIVWEDLREPVQVVWRRAVLPVREVRLDPEHPDHAAELVALSGFTMDLGTAPLIDAHTAAVPGEDRRLAVIRLPHMVPDHTAKEVLIREVAEVVAGRGDALPEPLPFRNFVAQARAGMAAGGHEEYFAGLLGDVTEPTTPYGLLDVRGDGAGIVRHDLPLEKAFEGRLREVARRLGSSVATVMHVAWARTLAAVSGRGDVVFGTVLFGRMNGGAGADRVAGPFMNMLPVRVRVDGVGVLEAVSGMRGQLAALLEHEHAPLAVAQRASGVPADQPLFTSMFNYRHNAGRTPDDHHDGGEDGIRTVLVVDRNNYPLSAAVNDDDSRLALQVDAVSSIDAESVVGLWLTATEALVSALEDTLSGGADLPLVDVDVLGVDERRRVLVEWNDTGAGAAVL
ncbi:condensation domain-containing protein, partial [Streptomyces violaceoruber]